MVQELLQFYLCIVTIENGNRIDNITDWGLEQFVNHYGNVIAGPDRAKQSTKQKQIASGKNPRNDEQQITKEDIFHYVYAVLHNPAYRKKYELNLKREFPREFLSTKIFGNGLSGANS